MTGPAMSLELTRDLPNRLREGGDRASSTHDTKAEAQAAGRAAAKKDGVEHLIHKKDGTIGERNSYGNDPQPPKG